MTPKSPEHPPFVLARSFDAPRELVWRVWTQPEHLREWFSPKGSRVTAARMDLRPGGVYHWCLEVPGAPAMWARWVFREIVAPERMVLIQSFSDEHGGIARAPFAPGWPLQTLSTMTFAEEGVRTRFTLTWVPYDATEAERQTFDAGRAGMELGWGGTMELLADYLAKAQANTDAPRRTS
jgi:uncharacterized protein YndB with AHSA1/START domain